MALTEELRQFSVRLAEHYGGVAEAAAAGLRLLLPPDLARILELPEEVLIGQGGLDLIYGSPLLDRMVHQATARTPVVLAQIAPPYLKRAGFDQVLARDFSFPNARVQITGTAEARTNYLVLSTHYAALSDERKEGLVEVAVQERSGAHIDGFCAQWPRFYPQFFAPEEAPPHFPGDLKRASRAAMEQAQIATREALADFLGSMDRRLHRDVRNTREYYAALGAEMAAGLDHPNLSEPQRRDRQAKIDLLPEEAERKIDDLKQKYQVRVVLRPAGAIRFLTSVVQVMASFQHRKWKRDLSLTWNPVTQALDPLVCESCEAGTRTLLARMERDRIQILCPPCAA